MQRRARLQKEIDKISAMMYGRVASECQKKKICVQCGQPATEFRDDLSSKEYDTSALCQLCQDPIFGLGEYAVDDDIPF